MILTFEFLRKAWNDENFMLQLQTAMQSDTVTEICTYIHRITFNPQTQTAEIYPLSDNSRLHYKIIPARITFHGLSEMLKQNDIDQSEVVYIYR